MDGSKVGMRGSVCWNGVVPIVDFDEVSGRIVFLTRASMDRNSSIEYGFVVDMR